MYVGYIRVSTDDQNLSLQKDALLKYGVDERNIFSDKTSGSKDKRVGLDKALEFLKEGDTLVIWKLDRLGRSLIQERVKAGLEAAKNRGIRGGRPRAISEEKMIAIKKALNDGMSKASICRTFEVKRSTLIDSLSRENI